MNQFTGNSLFPGKGICDRHLRVFNDRFYVHATHDLSPESTTFTMKDWWIWSSFVVPALLFGSIRGVTH